MSTGISTVYSAIVTKCDTIFSSKTRLHNPYELTDNPEIITKDSWGLKVLPAEKLDQEWCNLSIAREFSIVLLRQFATVGNKEDAFDSVTSSLLEDAQTFMNNFYSPTEIGVQDTIDQIEFTNIGGIDFMQADQKKYLLTEIGFRITISEALI